MRGVIHNHSVAVVTGNRRLRRHVTRALASAGSRITPVGVAAPFTLDAMPSDVQLVVVGADEEPELIRAILEQLSKEQPDYPVLLLAQKNASVLIAELVDQYGLNNLIARHGGMSASQDIIDEQELIVTCAKLLHRDIFGIEKYLPAWGVSHYTRQVHDLRGKDSALGELSEFLQAIDCHEAIATAIHTTADELLMNAIFNAPIDADGRRKYADVDRRTNLALGADETVDFSFACDGRQVALAVRDQFGSLQRDVIVRYLRQSLLGQPAALEEKEAGAGLGLHMIFNSINSLTFNILQGQCTEVIATFYVRSGVRVYKASGRSLNIFFLTPT